jgi:hypothetical protein
MKFMKMEVLIDKGDFSNSGTWETVYDHIRQSIKAVVWPPGSNKFTIYPQSGKKRNEGNGVKPIKNAFMEKLTSFGWQLEVKMDIATVKMPGKVDAVYTVRDRDLFAEDRYFAIEWETGCVFHGNRMSIPF